MKFVRFLLSVALCASFVAVLAVHSEDADAASPAVAAGAFTAVPAARLFDSRQTVPLAGQGAHALQVLGEGGLPLSGAPAVVLTVTATRATNEGYLSVNGGFQTVHSTSTLNFAPNVDVANTAVVSLNDSGWLTVFDGQGRGAHVDVVLDVLGWYATGTAVEPGTFASVPPTRVLDTRSGNGAAPGPVKSGGSVRLPVLNHLGLPSPAQVAAVVVNLTATAGVGPGYVTVHPGGSAKPPTSNLNFARAQAVAALVTAPVGADGSVELSVVGGPVHLIADVLGYVLGGDTHDRGAENVDTPDRVADTRSGLDVPPRKVAPGAALSVPLAGRGGVPSTGVAAVVLTVTVTNPTNGGHITVFGHGSPVPRTSNINYSSGQTVADSVVTPVGSDGRVDLLNATGGTTHLVVDVVAWIRSAAPPDQSTDNEATSRAYANLGESRLDATSATRLNPAWRAGNGDLRNPEGHQAVTVGGVLYSEDVPDDGQVSAVDVQTGRILWSRPTRNGSVVVGAAVYTNDSTDTPGVFRLAALDKADGHTLWTVNVTGAPNFTWFSTLSGGRLVVETVGDQDSGAVTFISVDAATGGAVRSTTIDDSADTYDQFGVADGRLFVSGSNTGLRAFDLLDGSPMWSDPSAAQGAIRNVGGRLYLNSPGTVASYDPSGCSAHTCLPAWVTTPEPSAPPADEVGFSQAAITANTIVIQASGNAPGFDTRIYYYSAITGQLIGQTGLPFITNPHPPVITPGLVWIVENDEVMVLPDSCPSSCQPLQIYGALDAIQPHVQIGDGTLLLLTGGEDGYVVAALH